jgi:poly-gamma-glutamate system protein
MERRVYMRLRPPPGYLVAALAAALLGFYLASATRTIEPCAYADVAEAAAVRMAEATRILKAELLEEGIAIETGLDPNKTGLIGPEWTPLTTTLGDLEAKRSTLNPNFAALLVRYFHDAGLKEGDMIAIGASGSFPGLLVATLCAAREMGLNTMTIASFGASTYGATRPEFSIAKMLRVLSAASVVPDSLIAVSPGGDGDYGENPMFEDSRAIVDRLAKESGARFIRFDPPDLEASIRERLGLYEDRAGGREIACFVNIGGASANSGTSSYTLDFPQGLVLDPPRIPLSATRGLVYEFAARGVPVINLLNVRRLAEENGLPFDPIPLPAPGEGGVYSDAAYEPAAIALALAAPIGVLVFGVARRRKRDRTA